jgi:hypothetical protein
MHDGSQPDSCVARSLEYDVDRPDPARRFLTRDRAVACCRGVHTKIQRCNPRFDVLSPAAQLQRGRKQSSAGKCIIATRCERD